jgi:tetratricopeptide (TPR) repeat protein
MRTSTPMTTTSVIPWCLAALAVSLLWSIPARAAEETKGQPDLDKAFELQLSAEKFTDLGEVAAFCRSALKKGLDADNTKFAKQLLASTLYQRGEIIAKAVLEATRPDPQLPQMRNTALSELEEALENAPELPAAQLLVARLHLIRGGDSKRAREALDAVVKSHQAENQDKAKAHMYRSVLEAEAKDRMTDLDESIRLNPAEAQAWRMRAALKLSMDKPDDAVKDFDEALKLDPKHAQTHEARGLALAAQKNWEEAKKSLTRATELAPSSTAALLQRGRVSLIMGDHKAAIADAEAALKAVPNLPSALLLRSHARNAAGDKKEAMADVDQVLKEFPDAAEALRTRAMLMLESGKGDEAVDDLEKLHKVEPDDQGVALQLAVLYNGRKDSKRAIELASEIVKADAEHWQAMRVRADAYLNIGKQKEALADYEAALKLSPKDTGILNNLAWLLATSPDEKVRNAKRSIELAEQACQITSYKAPHILSTLAAGYAEKGDFATAKKWSNKAIETAESDEDRTALRKELKSYEEGKPWREILTGAVDKPDTERK